MISLKGDAIRCLLVDTTDMKILSFSDRKDSLEKQAAELAKTTKRVYLVCTIISRWEEKTEINLPPS